MARVTYNSTSPYSKTEQTSWYLSHYNPRSVLKSDDDKKLIITAKYEHRPDLLSYDVYGTVGYWWVFMLRNIDVIKDPIYDMKTGIEIHIPQQKNIL